VAINSLKNTNAFNKIGIALQDSRPDPNKLLAARDRLLELTGEQVNPLPEKISKCVMHYFPDFQQNYAPLAVRLDTLNLAGRDRAQSIQDNLAEILKGDASDATNRLGGKDCPLFEDLCWAREVHKAFENGIGDIIKAGQALMEEIPKLPQAGIPGQLAADTYTECVELSNVMGREDFFSEIPAMQNLISEIQAKVADAANLFAQAQAEKLDQGKARLQALPEWGLLGTADKARVGANMDGLKVIAENNLDGIRKLLNDDYFFASEMDRLEKEIKTLAQFDGGSEEGGGESGDDSVVDVTLDVPKLITSAESLNDLIQKLESLKSQIQDGLTIKITWR
jgi:hypothetical protein